LLKDPERQVRGRPASSCSPTRDPIVPEGSGGLSQPMLPRWRSTPSPYLEVRSAPHSARRHRSEATSTLYPKSQQESSNKSAPQWRGTSPESLQPRVVPRTGLQPGMHTGLSTPDSCRTHEFDEPHRFITQPTTEGFSSVLTTSDHANLQQIRTPSPEVRAARTEQQVRALDLKVPTLSSSGSNPEIGLASDVNRGVPGAISSTQIELHNRLEALQSQVSLVQNTVTVQFKSIEDGLAANVKQAIENVSIRSKSIEDGLTATVNRAIENVSNRSRIVEDRLAQIEEGLTSKVNRAIENVSGRSKIIEDRLAQIQADLDMQRAKLADQSSVRDNTTKEAWDPLSVSYNYNKTEETVHLVQRQLDEHLGRISSLEKASQMRIDPVPRNDLDMLQREVNDRIANIEKAINVNENPQEYLDQVHRQVDHAINVSTDSQEKIQQLQGELQRQFDRIADLEQAFHNCNVAPIQDGIDRV